ncbi:uncharacterized protein LOC121875175 [Homarus americanus]|uniref:Telomere zinc finger-associated protein-like n=1 Tax=Homarus americanus TaxID=6706 RepID=A0A8J5JSS8_HOMAM|nr:uncharacterized protein LOC121875175 [Homarus americanus]KAG7161403.1 telomere zinc finger-associated protein-like [Homarus americanus]
MTSAGNKPSNVQETSSKSDQEPGTVVAFVSSQPDNLAKCTPDVDSVVKNSKGVQYSSRKSKNEEENDMVDIHVNVPSEPEQNSRAVVTEAHIVRPSEGEHDSTTSITGICISDIGNTKEELVTININDTIPNDTSSGKQNHASSDGNMSGAITTSTGSRVILSSPLITAASTKVKNVFTHKMKNTVASDGRKYVSSNRRNGTSVFNKQNVRNIVPRNLQSNESPVVSSKLHSVCADDASSSNNVKIKRTGSVVVRTISPRTIRNVPASYSSSKTGFYVDPLGTILITREMDDGRFCGSAQAKVPTVQCTKLDKLLSSTPTLQSNLQVIEHHGLRNSDGKPSTSQDSFIENSSTRSSCNDDILISRQLDDELADKDDDDDIAEANNTVAMEITKKISSSETVGQINNVYNDVQVGGDQRCCFCRSVLTREERITCMALSKPLPSSLLDPISLLHCLGITSPLPACRPSLDSSSIIVCQQCYSLVSDGDVVYQQLLSITSHMRQLWPKNIGDIIPAAFGSDSNKVCLKMNQIEKTSQNMQLSPKSSKKYGLILPKPIMAGESPVVPSGTTEKVPKVRVKQKPSSNKMRICGFCGMDLYGDDDWNLHQVAVHRIERKWQWFNLQPTLKTLLAKEIQHSNMRQSCEVLTPNLKCEKNNICKCTACSTEFSMRDELVEHLRHYHNMVIDEEFLSSILEDTDTMDWSNDRQGTVVENPVQIKSEMMWDEHGRARSSVSDVERDDDVYDNDTGAYEGVRKHVIINNVKKKKNHIHTEDQALPAPDECHNYIGACGNKGSLMYKTESSEKNQNTELHCKICAKLYKTQMDLDKHEQLEHPRSVRTNKKIDKENNLQTSLGDGHSLPMLLRARTKVTCKLCNQVCDSFVDLNNHIDSCHENSVVILEGDGYGGVIDRRLEMSLALGSDAEHIQKGAEGPELQVNVTKGPEKSRSFMCKSCGETFVNRLLLVRHKRSAHGDVCGVGGANGLVMVECELCGRRLHGIGSLRLHMSKVHKRSQKPPLKHRCKMCIYHSRTRNQLEKHMQEKHGLNVLPPVECKECGKMYSAKYIDIHIANMHENQKKFSCNFCSMKFNIKSSLKCHISYEHANNKWQCDKCHIQFEKYHQLRQHKIYVHSTKIYPCQQCGKTFKRKSDVTEHGKRRHQEKVPSECNYCTKVYADRKKLRTHLIKKHGVAWEDTLSKSYARHQRENNCLRKRQPRNSRMPRNLSCDEEVGGIEIQQDIEIQQGQYEFDHNGQQVHYEQQQNGEGFYEEQYQHDDPHQNFQEQHCMQLEEGTITTYEGANIGTLEDEQEYNVVQVTEGTEDITNVASISYIILEES